MKKIINNKEFVKHESGLFVARDGEVLFPANPNSKSRWKNGHTTYGSPDKDGYLRVGYHGKFYLVHRLVAQTYIDNPNNLPFVNHKSEIKNDNRVENLEYCDAKYNLNYGTRTQRAKEKLRGRTNTKNSKPVVQYDLSGNLIAVFPSTMEVERTLGYSQGHISECCLGKLKQSYGYKWRYV